MKPSHSLPALFICGLLSAPVFAAPWYRVEMMLVAYEGKDNMDQELWADALSATMTDENTAEQPDYQWWRAPVMYQKLHNALWAGFHFAEPPDANLPAPFSPLTLQLTKEAHRIDQQKDMLVVWHQAWIEPIQEEGNAVVHPLNIHVQDELDIQITGSFALHRSRYLHLDTDFIVQHYERQSTSVLNTLTLPDSDSRNDYRSDMLTQADIGASPTEAEPAPAPIRAAEVKQSRRMRSNELHYIDHPLLGIVIRIVPIEDAASLGLL